MRSVEGTSVIVTGGGSGLGAATAAHLASRGARNHLRPALGEGAVGGRVHRARRKGRFPFPITGRSVFGEDRAGRRIGAVAAGYEAWLAKQPLSENTKRAYRTRAGQFLGWLGATPSEYGDPLSDGHARDYAARDFKAHLKTVRKAKPSSVNLSWRLWTACTASSGWGGRR